jgi:hypothetical protein
MRSACGERLRQRNDDVVPARAGGTRRRATRKSPRPTSYPRARGARVEDDVRADRHPVVPARAGGTRCRDWARSRALRRTRARGGHAAPSRALLKSVKSYPRARGARLRRSHWKPAVSVVPARAGGTRTRRAANVACPRRTRARGGHAGLAGRSFRAETPRQPRAKRGPAGANQTGPGRGGMRKDEER